jgi:PAS domain S-box-containing protein
MANVVEFGGQHLLQGTFRNISDRKNTELALRESETKYRTLFEQSSDAIYLSTKGGRLLDLNDAGAALFGYSREEMLSLDVAKLYLNPTDWTRFVEAMAARGAVREYEATGVKKDGTSIECLVTVSQWCSEDGIVQGYQGLVRDVTEQRRAENELRQSEERFRTLVHHAPEAIVLWDLGTGKFVDANANAEQLFGLPRERLLELGPFDVSAPVQPDGRPSHEVTEFVEAVVAGESPVFEWLHCKADGKEVLCEVRLVLLPGEQPLVRGSMTDITERKQAEEVLRESVERFRAIFESAAVGIVVTRSNGAILQCNSAWERMIGFKAGEIRGMRFLELTHPEDVDSSSRAFGELAEGKRNSLQLEKRYVANDGSIVWGSTSVSAVRDLGGKLKYTIAMIENVTERKQAEVELESSRERLRNLAARLQAVREEERTTIAREIHDELGQVLTGLKMDLSWIADRLPRSSDEVRERARSMLSLMDTTVNSVRKLSTQLRPAVLDDLGLEAAVEWQASEFSTKANVECHLDLRLGDMDLDAERATAVFRILQETLTNVARHAGASGVWVELSRTDNELVLKVKDDGRGISDSEVASPRSLGLIGMRERAGGMGGQVEIKNEPNGGTEVLLRMPVD